MVMHPLRWGVLGASKFALNTMIPALHAARGAVVRVIASRTPEKAAPAQALDPQIQIIGDYGAVLARDDVDAVYIPLPNHLHVEWVLKAVAAGKHVLCEKPLSLDANGVELVMEAQAKSDRFIAEGFMVTHHPQWHRARQILADGGIGRLRHVAGHFTFYKDDPSNIRFRPETGGGALYDIGVYPLVTARFATGREPAFHHAECATSGGVDITTRASGRLGDATFDFFCAMQMFGSQSMTFFGEGGRLHLSAPFNDGGGQPARLHLSTAKGEIIEDFNAAQQYVLQAEAFGAAIAGNDFPCPLSFSLGNARALDQIRSLMSGACEG